MTYILRPLLVFGLLFLAGCNSETLFVSGVSGGQVVAGALTGQTYEVVAFSLPLTRTSTPARTITTPPSQPFLVAQGLATDPNSNIYAANCSGFWQT